MAIQGNRKKQVVWQDIVPMNKPQKPVRKKRSFLLPLKNIRLSLQKSPIYTKLRKKILLIPRKKRRVIIVATLLAIVIIVYSLSTFQTARQSNEPQAPNPATDLVRGNPSFSTLLPAGKAVESLGGWTRVSPSGNDPVFAYTDKISGVPIIVSQQQLPSNLKTNTAEQLEQLASENNASQKITVGSTIVYIGTSAKGVQSIFLIKNNLLILIKSDVRIDNDEWANYINSLQ